MYGSFYSAVFGAEDARLHELAAFWVGDLGEPVGIQVSPAGMPPSGVASVWEVIVVIVLVVLVVWITSSGDSSTGGAIVGYYPVVSLG